jgi:hypothetical protein
LTRQNSDSSKWRLQLLLRFAFAIIYEGTLCKGWGELNIDHTIANDELHANK